MHPSRMKVQLIALVGLSFLLSGMSYAQANPTVSWKAGKLSVEFKDATISQILNSIANTTGIKLSVDPSVGSFRESVSFSGLPLRKAILQVLEGSEIDYIIVGDPGSPQAVSRVMLLGFAPKGPATATAAMGGSPTVVYPDQNPQYMYGQQNPYNTNSPGMVYSGQTINQPPTPAGTTDSGRFLPFPEAAGGAGGEQQPQRATPPNPFNPNPAVNPYNPQQQQQTNPTTRRKPPTWPPMIPQ